MASSATHEVGHEFYKYRLREPISDSFLGTRYRAVSNAPTTGRAASNAFGSGAPPARSSAFALRLLRAPTAALIDRVARAAKAVRYLDHANVLAPIQLIRSRTRLGVLTQDVDGFTLSELLQMARARGEGLPQSFALRIALDVLDGVCALHATERDVKRYEYACGGLTPDSIHIGKDGRTRLLDPGVAGAAASLPLWGHDPVALAYTAPEQSGAEPNFDPCSDAFSIGVMLWEMLAGRTLFGAKTAAETLERLHKLAIPRVQRQHFMRGEPIAAALAHVVGQALQREPTERFLGCRDLAIALRASAEVGDHAQLAEHCHRLSGSAAGVFDSVTPPLPRSARRSSPFGIATSAVPPSMRPGRTTEESGELRADLFESDTAPGRAAQASSPATPPAPPEIARVANPISAFPISDFIPNRSTREPVRRRYAPIAVAAVVLLGLSMLVWQRTGGKPHADATTRAAAAQPPAAVSSNTPTVTTESTPAPVAAPLLPAPAPTPPLRFELEQPAPPPTASPAPKPAWKARRRAARSEAAKEPAASPPTDFRPGPFIPYDL